jgi:hypothetical protein
LSRDIHHAQTTLQRARLALVASLRSKMGSK